MPTRSLQLSIPSDLRCVRMVTTSIRAICQDSGFESETGSKIEICVGEALNNAIKHAYQGKDRGNIETLIELSEERLVIEICDTGMSLPPQVLEETPSTMQFDPNNRLDLPESGMGLVILKQVMDEVSYDSNNNSNKLRLVLWRKR